MRNKNKFGKKKPIISPPFLSSQGSTSLPTLLTPAPQVVQWDGERGQLQAVHKTSSMLFLPPHTLPLLSHKGFPIEDSSSWTSPTLVLPTGWLVWCGSCCGVLSLVTGSQVWQQTFSCVVSSPGSVIPGRRSSIGPLLLTAAFKDYSPVQMWGCLQAAGGCLLHSGYPWDARKNLSLHSLCRL